MELYDKLIVSGSLIERVTFPYEPFDGPRGSTISPERRAEIQREWKLIRDGVVDLDEKRTASSVQRTRTTIRRLVHANVYQYFNKKGHVIPPRFLTLTFEENITDLKRANRLFSKFVMRLNYQFKDFMSGNLRYLCVPEFQERGAVHYHAVIFNLPFKNRIYARLRKAYTLGRFEYTTINGKYGTKKIIAYISKYVTKQNLDRRLFGKKRYTASLGLKKPIEISNDVAVELIARNLSFFSDYKTSMDGGFGKVSYECFYLGDGVALTPEMLDEYSAARLGLTEPLPEPQIEAPEPPPEPEKAQERLFDF